MKTAVLDFLARLEKNNSREWFQENKGQYETAKREMESFVNMIIPEIAKFDGSVKYVAAKDCMFRIFRDVRFAKDKAPYKTNMGAWITASGRKSPGPGYYIHLQPAASFLAAGVYMPEPDQLKKIRSEIYYHADEFKSILNDKKLKKYTTGLSENEKGKMAPRDFPKDFADMELLKYKHYTISYPLRDEITASEHFHEMVVMAFKTMHPFNEFLRRALEG